MKPFLEFLFFILLPCFLATMINRFVLNNSVGNTRLVLYKLFRIATILAIASQIYIKTDFDSFVGGYLFVKALGYMLTFALIFDLFLIYPKNTNPNLIMMISNIVLWIVGILFFVTIIDHYNEIQTNTDGIDNTNIWNQKGTFNGIDPISNLSTLWSKRVLPKTNDEFFKNMVSNDEMLFNIFSSIKSSKK